MKKGMESEATAYLDEANATNSKHPELQALLTTK
ncbi:MAG: hypothetical protein ACJAX1_002450 [Neolewinella sp.]|jgi:hypothetical protein